MSRIIIICALLLPIAACNSAGVPLAGAYLDHQAYLDDSAHYKAFATTRARNSGQSWGWAFGERTPEEAIDAALSGCGQGRSTETTTGGCVLYSLGNRNVSGLSGAELEEAIRAYKANPQAAS